MPWIGNQFLPGELQVSLSTKNWARELAERKARSSCQLGVSEQSKKINMMRIRGRGREELGHGSWDCCKSQEVEGFIL